MVHLNSYGGMFIGFKAMAQQRNASMKPKEETAVAKPATDKKPAKLVIDINAVERIMLQELVAPNKLELIVTALFDQDDVNETFSHMRQSTKPVEAKYIHDSYTCDFDKQKIVLPCADKKQVILYVSCITSMFDEKNTRNVELKGYGHTKPIMLDKCNSVTNQKEQLNPIEAKENFEAKLSYNVTVTTEEDGPEIPEDRIGGLADFYNAA